MSTFGDLERAFADLYPYRWAFAAGLIIFLAAFLSFAYWKDWHRFVWRHRVRAGLIAAPVLVVTLWLAWFLGSPLFTNTTVDEEFPFAATATVPSDMDRAQVETVMAGLAKVESPVNEDMPVMPAATTPTPLPTVIPEPVAPTVIKEGQFQDIDGFHKGSGTATIYRGPDGSLLLRLEDFQVTNGPDLHVVLSPWEGPDGTSGGKFMSPGWIDLGKLKGNIGNQNYTIHDDVDIGIHNSVTIWCKPFNVIFSVAPLQDES
ncbi:MAG: DM13 domain-containing protein [Chloroflexi bacterium]|nr:DM13 domain-containing protein [Chloroflexota bacterium]